MAFGILHNFQLPGTERFFVDLIGSAGTFGEIDSYIDGNPNFPDESAGSNDSDEDNFISGDGIDVFGRARFRYLLPIGHGAEQAIPDYQLNDGFLVGGATGGTSWNPLKSGLTPLTPRQGRRSRKPCRHGGHSVEREGGGEVRSPCFSLHQQPESPPQAKAWTPDTLGHPRMMIGNTERPP